MTKKQTKNSYDKKYSFMTYLTKEQYEKFKQWMEENVVSSKSQAARQIIMKEIRKSKKQIV